MITKRTPYERAIDPEYIDWFISRICGKWTICNRSKEKKMKVIGPTKVPSEEQIARAICLASDGDPDDGRMGKPFWQFYTEQARAVLTLLERTGKIEECE